MLKNYKNHSIFKRPILLVIACLLCWISLGGLTHAQSNPFTQTPSPQTVQNYNDQQKIDSIPKPDQSAAKSDYCKNSFTNYSLGSNYEASELAACVDGVLQKAAGVSKNDSCYKYSTDSRKIYCQAGFAAATKGGFGVLGGHSVSGIKAEALEAKKNATKPPSGDDKKEQLDCDANWSPLSWIACPIIYMGAGMTDFVFQNFIKPLLQNIPISTEDGDGAFIAWQTFRILGNIILIGSLLIMVLAQNFNFLLDAYTIKKMAPRIVAGAIAINLSYFICLIAISVINVVSVGMNQALAGPFMDGFSAPDGIPIAGGIATDITGILGMGILAGAIGGIFAVGLGVSAVFIIGLILPFIVTIILVALAALFTVVLRQALIIFLTVISPVAIAAFILPGTEKYARKWWDLFLKTLMVYPIIAVIFAMSNVMGIILMGTAGGGTLGVAQIITTIIVIYAPLALVPFSFKFAGGAIGAIGGFANQTANKWSAAAGQSIRKSRENPDSWLGKNTHAFRARREQKNLYAGDAIGALGAGIKSKRSGRGFREGWNKDRAERREANAAARAEFMAKNSKYAKASSQIDEAQMDMAKYESSKASRDAILNGSHISYSGAQQETARKLANGEFVSDDERQSYNARQQQLLSYSDLNDLQGRTHSARLAASKSAAALSYGYSNGEEGWKQAVDIANDLYGGDETSVMRHLNELQYVASQVGRSDLSGNVNSLTYDQLRAGGKMSASQVMSSGKPAAVAGIIEEQMKVIQNENATYKQKKQALDVIADFRASSDSPYSSPANKQALANYSSQIDSVTEKFFQDESGTMRAQAQDAAASTDPETYVENIFAPVERPAPTTVTESLAPEVKIDRSDSSSSTSGGTVHFSPQGQGQGGAPYRTTPESETIEGPSAAQYRFRQSSGHRASPDDLRAQEANRQEQGPSAPEE